MPGAGITERNKDFFFQATKAKEIHLAINTMQPSKIEYKPQHIFMGGYLHLPEFGISRTDKNALKRITSH
jgi:copper homeostasis protein